MVDSCYVCRRTQADLDRTNEEIRARVYLAYFSNARGQIEDEQRKIRFLHRLKEEEGADPHFRIGAAAVFRDPDAYRKLMPWVDTLREIANASPQGRAAMGGTIGELVDALLAEERAAGARLEESLDAIRRGFVSASETPLALHPVNPRLPVDWRIDRDRFVWHETTAGAPDPLVKGVGDDRLAVEVPLHICTACRAILRAA